VPNLETEYFEEYLCIFKEGLTEAQIKMIHDLFMAAPLGLTQGVQP
jgi:hypothetical protein